MQVLQEVYGLEGEALVHAATGFPGGIGGVQSVCGAISGGVIAMGFQMGKNIPDREERFWRARKQAGELYRSFAETFGHADCRPLTGYDFSAPGGYDAFKKSGIREERCVKQVEFVVRQLMALKDIGREGEP